MPWQYYLIRFHFKEIHSDSLLSGKKWNYGMSDGKILSLHCITLRMTDRKGEMEF